MTILSHEPLTESELENVVKIFCESQCPHESLAATFPRYSGLLGEMIFFDGVDPQTFKHKEAINVVPD